MPRTTERAEIIAALGLEPEGRGKSDRYNMTLAELRHKLKTQGARQPIRGSRSAAPKSDRVTEADVDAALRVIRADYWQDVRDVGDEIKRRIRDGEIKDSDTVRDAIAEEVDGTARVIYTLQNHLGLLASDNSSAYIQEIGVPMQGDDINYAAMMSMAMQQDVGGYLGDFDDLFNEEDED